MGGDYYRLAAKAWARCVSGRGEVGGAERERRTHVCAGAPICVLVDPKQQAPGRWARALRVSADVASPWALAGLPRAVLDACMITSL